MYDAYRVALVTGAARGIGRAICENLAQAGLDVVVCDVLQEEAEATAEALTAMNVRSMAATADVSDREQVETMVNQAVDALGSVDFLINNAGITRDNLSIRMSQSEWESVIKVNLTGAFVCSQAVAKRMMKRRFGRIVNMASVSGIIAPAGQANYAASKAGLLALTKSMARELGGRNITVNAITPGFILTEMTEKLSDKVKQQYMEQVALKRAGTPEDVAQAVRFLISPAASYITGSVINVSGGLLMSP